MGLNNFDDGWDACDFWDCCDYFEQPDYYDQEDEQAAELCSRCAERPWVHFVDDSDPSVGYRGEGYLCDVCLKEVRRP